MPVEFVAPPLSDLRAILPQLIVAALAMVVLLADAIWPKMSKRALADISIAGLLAALVIQIAQPAGLAPVLQNMVIADQFAKFFNIVFLVGTLISVMLSVDYLEWEGISHGEYYALLLLTTVGMMIMAGATDLIIVFLGLEILSISLYVLAGYARDRLPSEEAALKYFLLGSFASAFFLYGVALIYGATQSTNLLQIASQVATGAAGQPQGMPLLIAGAALLVVGFGFKVAVVPFHVWTPDVYEGAPTSVTAFMSVGAKAAGFAAFLRVFIMALPGLNEETARVVALLAALTMIVGNFIAVVQRNLKRLLAYSSIAHAGYIMVGMVAVIALQGRPAQGEAIAAVLFYTLAYTVTNLGAFGVMMAFRRHGEEVLELDDYAGLGLKYPALGALMTLFMISLAGLPPTAGFLGKLYLFRTALDVGSVGLALVIIGVLTSVVSVYYYLAVIVRMYMAAPSAATEETRAVPAPHLSLALGLTAVATLLLGILPNAILLPAQQAWQSFQQSVARL